MITKKILSVYDWISEWRVRLPRLIDARKEFRMKKPYLNCSRITAQQERAAKKYWGKLYGKIDNRYLSLYNSYSDEFDPRYVPDDLYYGIIDTYFNKALECAAVDDKNWYDLYFADVKQPLTIARKVNGTFLNRAYKMITIEEAMNLCVEAEAVVLKKATLSEGGKGIQFWQRQENEDCCVGENSRSADILFNILNNSDDIIVQKLINQHPNIGQLHANSVNTIRILTMMWGNQVEVLSAIIRMGANGSKVDNGHSGGCFAGIDDSGRVKDVAYDYMTGERYLHRHPTSGAKFSDTVIPNFEDCKSLVRNLAPRLSRVSRLTSWDLSIDECGEPILLEVNLCWGGLFFHQIANGPIFGDKAVEILEKILNTKHK